MVLLSFQLGQAKLETTTFYTKQQISNSKFFSYIMQYIVYGMMETYPSNKRLNFFRKKKQF